MKGTEESRICAEEAWAISDKAIRKITHMNTIYDKIRETANRGDISISIDPNTDTDILNQLKTDGYNVNKIAIDSHIWLWRISWGDK